MEIRKYFRLTFLLFIFSTTCFVSSVLSGEITRNHMDSLPGCEGDSWGGWCYGNYGGISIVTSDSPDGGNMLKYTFSVGTTAGEVGKLSYRGPAVTYYPEVYIQFYHKYASNYFPNLGGNKILYMYSDGNAPVFSWHPNTNINPTGEIRMSQIWAAGDVEAAGSTGFYPVRGTWYKYKFHFKANTSPGTADGILQIWVDDVLKTNMSNVVYWRTGETPVNGWNRFVLSSYYGGGAGTPTPEESYSYFDDAIISTTDIGTSFKPSSNPGSPIILKIQ